MTTLDDMERRIAALEARLAHQSQGGPTRPGVWRVGMQAGDGTFTIQRLGNNEEDPPTTPGVTITGIPCLDPGAQPLPGDRVWLLWDKRGKPGFHAGQRPALLKAAENMTANDTFYDAYYLKANGTTASTITVKRPPGIKVEAGDYGFLGKDAEGSNLFMPCHARHYEQLPLTLEVRSSDLADPETGRIWLRSDLT